MERNPRSADTIEEARRRYAEELRSSTHMDSPELFAAFASVPRERFVGPGPWRILRRGQFAATGDTDSRHVYHDVLITLDAARGINNGQPSLWAYYFDQLRVGVDQKVLHLGCGTGYYTAILAELVGRHGKVTAIEIDEALAERARVALEPWPQVTLVHRDGSVGAFEPADVLVSSAGATHPLQSWLDTLGPGGKMLFPLTTPDGTGAMALLHRTGKDIFAAHLTFGTAFIDFSGACDPKIGRLLSASLQRDHGATVRSLRCDPHPCDKTCWLHGEGWCFSMCDPVGGNLAYCPPSARL